MSGHFFAKNAKKSVSEKVKETMAECEAYRMAPCPFCGSEIKHVESWAKSFNPPRLYHEWQHVDDNMDCWIRRRFKVVGSATEDGEMQKVALDQWNRRDEICPLSDGQASPKQK